MPILPLDHPEPFAAVLGVMLYPKSNEQARSRAFAAHYLAAPIRAYEETGCTLSRATLSRLIKDGGARLDDLDKRWYGGTMTGELLKVFFALWNNTRARASWKNAALIIEGHAARSKVSGSRSSIMKAKSDFHAVAHLWAAYAIRKDNEFFRGLARPFRADPNVGYNGFNDFQSFLTEAEILRRWGQTWRRNVAKAEPPLPPDAWRVPDGWQPPERKPGWPLTGVIPDIGIDEADLDRLLQPAGRPGRPRKLPKKSLSKI